MKIFRTLGLLIVLFALSAYVYFYEIKGGEERDQQKSFDEKIFHFENDSISLVEIRSIFNRFRFERNGGTWVIQDPVKTDADENSISSLLTTLSGITKQREFAVKEGDQKNYGLVARSLLVTVQHKNGQRDSLRFGDQTAVENSNYAGRGDTLVYIVSGSSKSAVEKQLFDWRDKSISKIDHKNVVEMRLRNKNGAFTFVKEGMEWKMTEPRNVPAENLAVNTMLRKIQNDKVKSIISEDFTNPEDFGLRKPGYVADLYFGEGKAHKQVMFSFLRGNVSNGKDSSRPHVFTVDSTFIKEFDKSFFELRDKKVVTFFNRERSDSIVVEQGDSLIAFVKDSTKTWVLAGNENKIKSWKVNSILGNVFNITAEKFLLEGVSSTRQYGLSRPEWIVRIFREGNQDIEVHFSSPNKDQYVAYCPDSKIVAEISETSFNNLKVNTEEFIEQETGTE